MQHTQRLVKLNRLAPEAWRRHSISRPPPTAEGQPQDPGPRDFLSVSGVEDANQLPRLADLNFGRGGSVPCVRGPTYDFEPIMPVLRALSIASVEPNFSKVALAAA
jgi:hypothetical protein